MILDIPYPLVPFLKIEFSDVVILITFVLFGFKEAVMVAVVKTIGDLFQGVSGPMAIGQITALIASLSYVLLLKLTNLNIKTDKIKSIIFKSLIILLSVTLIMTITNYIFITPIYHGKYFWFEMDNGGFLGADKSYLLAIIITYIPFNLIKGSLILIVYYLIAPRIITIYENKIKG